MSPALIATLLEAIGAIVKIGLEAKANADASEAEVLARLKVALASASANVDEILADLAAARAKADERLAASVPPDAPPAAEVRPLPVDGNEEG